MKKLISYIVLGTWLMFVASSCIDIIDFDRPVGEENEYVIQGRIVKGTPSIARVEITEVFDKSGFVNPRRISVREVLVENNEGQSIALSEVAPGTYEVKIPQGDPSFSIETGMSFRTKVTAITGDKFESEFETMNEVPPLKKMDVQLFSKEIYDPNEQRFFTRPFMRYTIDTDLIPDAAGNKPILKWDVLYNYALTDSPPGQEPKLCYITNELASVTNVSLVNSNEGSSTELTDFLLLEAPASFVYAEGHYATVLQESLSSNAYKYWEQLRSVVDRTGSVFDTPVGSLISNINPVDNPQREAIGYFYATQQDTLQLFISPADAGNPRPFCPPPMAAPGFGCTLGNCCDCLRFAGSALEKPSFWTR